jgi:hypothetical protein
MRKTVMMMAVAAMMLVANVVNAQTFHRADRRGVQVRDGYSPREMRQINFAKKQLQREIMFAKADGIITFREQRAIDLRKRDLQRLMYISRNNMIVRR